jgi:hypothetical protein
MPHARPMQDPAYTKFIGPMLLFFGVWVLLTSAATGDEKFTLSLRLAANPTLPAKHRATPSVDSPTCWILEKEQTSSISIRRPTSSVSFPNSNCISPF